MPFKANAACRHHIPKQKRRVTNWAAYDASLRQRGSLTIWFLITHHPQPILDTVPTAKNQRFKVFSKAPDSPSALARPDHRPSGPPERGNLSHLNCGFTSTCGSGYG